MAGYLFLLLAFPLEMTAWHVSEAVIDPASGHSVLGLTSFREQLELLFPLIFSSFDIDGLVMAGTLIESKLASQSALMSAGVKAGVCRTWLRNRLGMDQCRLSAWRPLPHR